MVGSQADAGWNFESAFQAGASIIPVLLLALILEPDVLQHTAERSHLGKLLIPGGETINLGAVARLAVLAEAAGLIGLAVPSEWYERPPGRIVAFVALAFLGYVIFVLFRFVLEALVEIAARADSEARKTVNRKIAAWARKRREAPGGVAGTSDTTGDGLDAPDGGTPEGQSTPDIGHEKPNDRPHP